MILSLISQEGGGGLDLIWWILPVLCCFLAMGQRGEEKPRESEKERENFYTTLNIDEVYESVEERAAQWRQEAKEKGEERGGIVSTVRKLLGGGPPPDRFTERDKQPPRLYSLNDSTGAVYFEFTEVEGGGTVVKATYSPVLKGRVSKLKADLPLKIPAPPVGLKCPSCGKPVHEEFNLCPYCGTQLIKE